MADPFDFAVNYYQQNLGLTPDQARGAVRWMQRIESGLNPAAFNPAGGGQGALGIAQWRGPRQQSLISQYGRSPSLEQQLAFSVSEMRGPYAHALQALKSTGTEPEAFRAFGKHYEVPSPAEYAKATGGYSSGLRVPSGPAEGYYDNSLHLTLRPEQKEPFPMEAALDALLGGQPTDEGDAGTHPLMMLDQLLGSSAPQSDSRQRTATDDSFIEPRAVAPARDILSEQPPLAPTEMRPIEQIPRLRQAQPASFEAQPNRLLDSLLAGEFIEPLGQGQAAPPLPQQQAVPQAASPPAMLDSLLQGVMSSVRAGGGEVLPGVARGVRRGAEAGFTGQPIEREGEPPITSAAEAAGAVPGVIAGGMLSPLRVGGEALQAAMSGQPVGAQEMLTAGMAGMDPIARLPGGVSRETPGAIRGVLASEQGAIPLPPKLVQGIKDAAKGIEKAASPSTVDKFSEAGEMLFRHEVGQARRSTEKAEAQISARGPLANRPAADMMEAAREPWRPLVQRYVPEFEGYIAAKQAGQSPPKPALLRFLDFVETRSRGTQYQGPPELRPLADTLRKIYQERELAIAAEPSTSGAHFIEDYYAHQYKDPAAVARSFSASSGRQGSGRALRQRSIPTLSEAIDRGFVPVTADPIDMTMRYVSNMDRYLAHNRIFRIGRDSGMIRFYARGHEPDGWRPLEGRLAERAVATGGVPDAIGLQAYAPDGFARIYNNSVALGFRQGEIAAKVYDAFLHTKNAITQSVLALSGYHAMAMAQEAAASAFASGIQKLKAGDIAAGLKDVGLGAIPGVKAGVDVLTTGRKMERQYRGIDDYGPDFERVANLYAGAGGRMVGRGAEYQGTAAQNYFTAWRRGQTLAEIKAGARNVAEGNPVYAPLRAIGFVARELARINETITAPLFDKMIPRLKAAAFYDEMSEWLAKNPMATHDEQLRQAREISDTMDDRFGELVMDNLFWARRAKQTLQLAATSLGWEHGSIRSIGGSVFDAVRGRFSPRVRYVIGLGSAIALENAAYQYLKTGTYPGQDTGGVLSMGGALDLTMPRTGGQTPEHAAERAMLPGFEKDIVGYMHDPIGEFMGKASPAARLGIEFFTGRDFFGRNIAPYPKYTPEWYKAYGNHVLETMTPIPMKQEQLKGTAMGQAERYAGNRPAPERWQNPQRVDQMETAHHIKDLKSEAIGLQAHGARTKEERAKLNARMKDIQDKIAKLQRDLNERNRERQSSDYLYKPQRDLRQGTGTP